MVTEQTSGRVSGQGSTRERILATARELFAAHTYGAATMRQIAQRVGITKPSLYHHFVSKAAILEELIGQPVDELATVIDQAADSPDVRRRVLGGFVDVLLAHRDVLGLLFRDASVYSEETSHVVFRMVDITERAIGLLAGADGEAGGWRSRLRAAQALAAATDPISYVEDVPQDELREQLLLGANAVLEVGP